MKQKFFELRLKTNGQKLYNFTDQTINWIKENSFSDGILNLSIQHTSASLIVQENADPDVQKDFFSSCTVASLLTVHPTPIGGQSHFKIANAIEKFMILKKRTVVSGKESISLGSY